MSSRVLTQVTHIKLPLFSIQENSCLSVTGSYASSSSPFSTAHSPLYFLLQSALWLP
ncbi:unnamed protein product [Hymenolepis diminuta]|uniref:Uncharacterized protein n=1 Tax=Hymenolepis diminuta TaxID=6216 RepID=A0A564YL88_HYMDI|nr:unnamed protein product [Hymenolepis diminuta]